MRSDSPEITLGLWKSLCCCAVSGLQLCVYIPVVVFCSFFVFFFAMSLSVFYIHNNSRLTAKIGKNPTNFLSDFYFAKHQFSKRDSILRDNTTSIIEKTISLKHNLVYRY